MLQFVCLITHRLRAPIYLNADHIVCVAPAFDTQKREIIPGQSVIITSDMRGEETQVVLGDPLVVIDWITDGEDRVNPNYARERFGAGLA